MALTSVLKRIADQQQTQVKTTQTSSLTSKAQKALETAQKNTTIKNVVAAAKAQALADGSTNKEADFQAKSIKREAQRLKDTQNLEVSILKKESGGAAAKAEQTANKIELQEYLGGLLANNFTTEAQNLTQASTYDTEASRVDDRVLNAYNLVEKYNINPVNHRYQTYTTIRDGIGLGLIDKYIESGGTKPGEGNKDVKTALDRLGDIYGKIDSGQSITQDDLLFTKTDASGNVTTKNILKKVSGTDNLFRASYGDDEGNDRNVVSEYYAQNEDGTYTPLALDKFYYNFDPPPPPEQKKKKWYKDPGAILSAAAGLALSFVPGAQALATQVGGFLSGGLLSGAAATGLGVGALNAGITGAATGNLESALKSGLLSGVGSAIAANAGISEASLAAQDASQLASQGLSNSAIQSTLAASGLDPVLAASAADLAVSGATSGSIASSLSGFGDIYGKAVTGALTGLTTNQPTAPRSLTESEFIAADAIQLRDQGLSNTAIQQNLVGAGVDPVIAASAADQAVMGGTIESITSDLTGFEAGGTLFPGVQTGSLTGFSTTTGGNTLSLKDILNTARIGNTLTNLFGQQTSPQQQQTGQMQPTSYIPDYTGVDYSGLLGLLSQRARRADIASLLG